MSLEGSRRIYAALNSFKVLYDIIMLSLLISSLLHSRVTLNLEWCDKIKLSNLLLL